WVFAEDGCEWDLGEDEEVFVIFDDVLGKGDEGGFGELERVDGVVGLVDFLFGVGWGVLWGFDQLGVLGVELEVGGGGLVGDEFGGWERGGEEGDVEGETCGG
uniref:hypothetical protein n=1 Tax=Neisseria sicca TaxID=490 RepID=UPI001C99B6B4